MIDHDAAVALYLATAKADTLSGMTVEQNIGMAQVHATMLLAEKQKAVADRLFVMNAILNEILVELHESNQQTR